MSEIIPSKSGQMRQRNIIIVVVVIAAIAVGGTAYYFQTQGGGEKKKTTIRLWHSLTEGPLVETWENAIEAFEKKNPNIEINANLNMTDSTLRTKIPVSAAAGSPPNIIGNPGLKMTRQLVKNDFILPLNEFFQKESIHDLMNYKVLKHRSFGGKYYEIILGGFTEQIIYNEAIFKEAGVEVPDGPLDQKSWEDWFIPAVKKIKNNTGAAPIALAAKVGEWMPHIWMMGLTDRYGEQEVFTKAVQRFPGHKFTNEPFVNALNQYKRLAQMGAFQEGYQGDVYTAVIQTYGNGQAAMVYNGTWFTQTLKKKYPETYEKSHSMIFPRVEGGPEPQDTGIGGVTYELSILKGTEKQNEAAKDFIEFFITANDHQYIKQYLRAGGAPSYLKGVKTPGLSRVAREMLEILNNASYIHTAWDTPPPQKWVTSMKQGIRMAISGQKSVRAVLQTWEQKAQSLKEEGALPLVFWEKPGS